MSLQLLCAPAASARAVAAKALPFATKQDGMRAVAATASALAIAAIADNRGDSLADLKPILMPTLSSEPSRPAELTDRAVLALEEATAAMGASVDEECSVV